ncbi:MAG: dihydroneopterin aldolase [Nitrospiria bacterium]
MIVTIKNLRLRTIVGVYEWEKKNVQEIRIHIRVTFDGTKAAESDDIQETIDYKKLRNQIISHVEGTDFNLVEKIASDVADIALGFPIADKAVVEVEKPGALRLTDSVSIVVEKTRSDL